MKVIGSWLRLTYITVRLYTQQQFKKLLKSRERNVSATESSQSVAVRFGGQPWWGYDGGAGELGIGQGASGLGLRRGEAVVCNLASYLAVLPIP